MSDFNGLEINADLCEFASYLVHGGVCTTAEDLLELLQKPENFFGDYQIMMADYRMSSEEFDLLSSEAEPQR